MVDERSADKFLEIEVSHLYCDNVIDKKDLFQEIIANLWKAYPNFKGYSKVSTWIYRISLNTAISWFRNYKRKSNQLEYTELMPQIQENPGIDELYEQLYNAISKLGKLDKAIILLQLDGYSHTEISEIVGITKTNVATKINRIKIKLKHGMYDD
jgi:RNA polymerase sigma-70 factor (ECF subfamily)